MRNKLFSLQEDQVGFWYTENPFSAKLVLQVKPPTVNSYWKAIRGSSKKRISENGLFFKNLVKEVIFKKCPNISSYSGDVTVSIFIAKKGREKGDIDNYLKSLFDSITGIIITDDSQIQEIYKYKIWRNCRFEGVGISIVPYKDIEESTEDKLEILNKYIQIHQG